MNAGSASPPLPGFTELLATFFKIGCISFGGAAGQIAMMHRMIVDEKKWVSEEEYLAALNFCTLLPGPEAQQLATWIGWRLHGLKGGVASGLLFVLPGALLVLLIAQTYVLGAGIPVIDGLLLGIKAAVVAVIVEAVLKFGKRALKSDALRMVALTAFLAMTIFAVPFPVVIIVAALAGILIARNTANAIPASIISGNAVTFPGKAAVICLLLWWLPVALAALLLGAGHFLVDIGQFFSKLAVITFGGAYAVLAYLTDEAVARGWVNARQMMDGLGFAETTPGPTILVNPFVAFLAGWQRPSDGVLPNGAMAWLAGLMALWTTFAPSFLWIFVGGPYLDRINANPTVASALRGISAAVVGVIATVGAKFILLFVFPSASIFNWGPVSMLVPKGSIDWIAAGLCVCALFLTFIRHWPILRMMGLLTVIGALLGIFRIPV